MLNENKINTKLFILIGSIIFTLIFMFCSIQSAYASENKSLDSDEVFEADRIAKSTLNYPEMSGDESNTYHVRQESIDHKNFNKLTIQREERIFYIEYDYRGYFGNENNINNRKANVQYFYNSDTKTLYLIGFGETNSEYDTYQYLLTESDTVFEKTIRYSDENEFSIANNVEQVTLDTKITNLKDNCLKGLKNLNKIDIIGQMYYLSNLNNLSRHCLSNCGSGKTIEANIVKSRFLRGNLYKLIYKSPEWHVGTNVTVNL